MKVLVDTSVWSLLLNRPGTTNHPAALYLEEQILNSAPIFITGIIFQEILQGIRSKSQFLRIEKYLRDFPFLETTRKVHEQAAGLFNISRGMGVQSQTVDCLIAASAIHYGCHLLTTDRDFSRISGFMPLRLAAHS